MTGLLEVPTSNFSRKHHKTPTLVKQRAIIIIIFLLLAVERGTGPTILDNLN